MGAARGRRAAHPRRRPRSLDPPGRPPLDSRSSGGTARHNQSTVGRERMMETAAVTAALRRYGAERIIGRIDASSSECWLWTGELRKGYGCVKVNGRRWSVHRLLFEALIGPIPQGLELDHLCRNRTCCNPAHLEPVTHAENIRRGDQAREGDRRRIARIRSYCKNGHEVSPENTYLRPPNGHYRCRRCANLSNAAYRAREKLTERVA